MESLSEYQLLRQMQQTLAVIKGASFVEKGKVHAMAWLRFCTCSAEEQCWPCAIRPWPGSGSVHVVLKSSAGPVPVGHGLAQVLYL